MEEEELRRIRIYEVNKQIDDLRMFLIQTDYKAIKYAEGLLKAEEYEPIKQQRQAWRDEINQLEEEISQL